MRNFARVLVPLCMLAALAGCYGGGYDEGGYYGSYPASYGYYGYSGYAPSYSVGFSYYDGGGGWNRHGGNWGGWHDGGHRYWMGNNGGWSHGHR